MTNKETIDKLTKSYPVQMDRFLWFYEVSKTLFQRPQAGGETVIYIERPMNTARTLGISYVRHNLA